jgi:hypothetical protein
MSLKSSSQTWQHVPRVPDPEEAEGEDSLNP